MATEPEIESTRLKKMMLAVSRIGARIFRNNVGKAWQGKTIFNGFHKGGDIFLKPGRYLILKDHRIIHFGLMEGSSDGIGYLPTVVTQEMVGKTIAIFLALEAKTDSGKLTPPQAKFIDVINKAGGIAGVARNEEEALDIILKGCDYRN